MAFMRILTLNHEYPPIGGGAAPVAEQLARRLVGLGHTVDVVTMHHGGLPRQQVEGGVTVYRTACLRKKAELSRTHEMASWLLGAGPTLRRLVRQNHYDLIHAHFIFPAGPLARKWAAQMGIPWVITAHGSDVPGHNPDRFVLLHKLLMPTWRKVVVGCPQIISPSGSLRGKILAHCPNAQVAVIPNGIDIEPFAPVEKTPSILLCGRMLRFKGFQYALEAMGRLGLDWPVHVVGDGEYLPELRRLAAGLKTPVKFWGWMNAGDPAFLNLFKAGSILIHPSEMENFPTVLLQAMAAGMAIITSTAGGCVEVVGDAALQVPPGDVEEIRACLRRLTEQPELRRQLAQAALTRVNQFTWDQIARRYNECFYEVVEKNRIGS